MVSIGGRTVPIIGRITVDRAALRGFGLCSCRRSAAPSQLRLCLFAWFQGGRAGAVACQPVARLD